MITLIIESIICFLAEFFVAYFIFSAITVSLGVLIIFILDVFYIIRGSDVY